MSTALCTEEFCAENPASVDQILRTLFASLEPDDYFSLNAFVPFRGYGRREALERMRNRVASRLGVASCLEIGPRYLHSTGQFHKGGPNTGVFLFLSANEDNDIAIPGKDFTLGTLATTQAHADFEALCSRARRAVQVHLADNDSETLSRFADRVCAAISAVKPPQPRELQSLKGRLPGGQH
jgi:glucose-6-phosphate isomerase